MSKYVILICLFATSTALVLAEEKAGTSTKSTVHKIEVGGEGGWDYLTAPEK